MQEVLGYLLLGSFAGCVPNIELYLLWLAVLAVAWHLHYLVLVFDSDCWLKFAESVRDKLVDDGGLTHEGVAY